jgi:RND superfamily putative drug exporter
MSRKSKGGIAARAGRWSARHRKIAILGWLAVVIAAFYLGGPFGTGTETVKQKSAGDAGRAEVIQDDAFPESTTGAGETVLIQSKTLKASDPAYRAVVKDLEKRMHALPEANKVQSPYAAKAGKGLISPDKHSVLVSFEVPGTAVQTEKRVDATLAVTKAVQRAHPDYTVAQFGSASSEKELMGAFEKDLQKAETLSLPITLLILLVAFGALVAAGLPLLLGLTAVAGTMGLVGLVSQLMPVSSSTGSVVLLVGLAVGVDYSLFYIRREREERKAGRSKEQALEIAAATSGRTVLISGLTVITAMAGLYFAGDAEFTGLATGSILVVAMAMLGSITVLPAMLSKVGDGVDRGRIPFLGKRMQRRTESRIWGAILGPVMRHPVVSTVLATALLVALAIPALGMHTAQSGLEQLPQTPIMKTFERMQDAFPGTADPGQVVIKADDVSTPEVASAIGALKYQVRHTKGFEAGITTDQSENGKVAIVSVPLGGSGNDSTSYAALAKLRTDIVPQTVGKLSGAEVVVGGNAASSKDYNDLVKGSAPIVFAFVLTFAFLLLLVTFRSIIVPIKAIVLNLLSVGASYGALTLIFQHGWLHEQLGFETPGFVTSWLPLFLFVILFGLSMDYHVYILSRVREGFDRGLSTDEAVTQGIKQTAGVVTSAAFVMVGVFAIFGTLSIIDYKMLGVGLGFAIFIDATIVRAVLLPASMKLLGDRNWYLPSWLEWLPRLDHEGSVDQPEPKRGPELGLGPIPEPAGA